MKIRYIRGYSRDALAEKANISSKYLYEVEYGKKCISIRTLIGISDALKVSVMKIIYDSDSMTDTRVMSRVNTYPRTIQEKIELLFEMILDLVDDIDQVDGCDLAQ